MSASIDASAIFMHDEPNKIKNKITKHAFSGGRETVEEQRVFGEVEAGCNISRHAEIGVLVNSTWDQARYFVSD